MKRWQRTRRLPSSFCEGGVKGGGGWMLKFEKKLSVDVNDPSDVGVVLPRKTTGAFAHSTGAPPAGPGSQNTAVDFPVVGSIVASTTFFPHHAPTGYPTV